MNSALKNPLTYLIAAMAGLMGAGLYIGIKEDHAKLALKEAFSLASGDTIYSLESAHSVAADYDGASYAYNFENETVFASRSQHVGFGGAGSGGLESFNQLSDPNQVGSVRARGCDIAAQAKIAVNPGWPVTDEFKDRQTKAAAFAARYCP